MGLLPVLLVFLLVDLDSLVALLHGVRDDLVVQRFLVIDLLYIFLLPLLGLVLFVVYRRDRSSPLLLLGRRLRNVTGLLVGLCELVEALQVRHLMVNLVLFDVKAWLRLGHHLWLLVMQQHVRRSDSSFSRVQLKLKILRHCILVRL